MYGLPEKQLSFLLQASCDTLPTPLSVAHWNIIASPVYVPFVTPLSLQPSIF